MTLSRWALEYVNLVLAVGRHDGNFVDAYYGPDEWKAAAEAGNPRPLAELRAEAQRVLAGVGATAVAADELVRDWVVAQGGTADNPARRWEVFVDLISSPRLPKGLGL